MKSDEEMAAIIADASADYIASAGDLCGVCARRDAYAIGRVTGVTLTTGRRYSAPACEHCTLLLLTGDWRGLERLVFEYQAQAWTLWESLVHRRRARRVARNIARWNAGFFSNLADPNDALKEASAEA